MVKFTFSHDGQEGTATCGRLKEYGGLWTIEHPSDSFEFAGSVLECKRMLRVRMAGVQTRPADYGRGRYVGGPQR